MNRMYQWIAGIMLLSLLTGCSVSPSDYISYYKQPENGFRKEIPLDGIDMVVQYMTPELKALNDVQFDDKNAFRERVEELSEFYLFELEVGPSGKGFLQYLKQGFENDLMVVANGEEKHPVFYHVEQNPLTHLRKVQVYFLKDGEEKNCAFNIQQNSWMKPVTVNIDLSSQASSPQLIL